MKCLSLWQPWASLLVRGEKKVETRGWPMRHTGPLLIHAAKQWNANLAVLVKMSPFAEALRGMGVMFSDAGKPNLPFGAIVGRVNVVDCFPTEDVSFDFSGLDATPHDPVDRYAAGKLRLWHEEKEFGDYSPGRFAILCADFEAFEKPIPYRGFQGLFDVPDSILAGAGL